MAGDIQFVDATAGNDYALLLDSTGRFRRIDTGTWEAYTPANYAAYAITATEQGASGIYLADLPAGLGGARYGVVARRRAGATPAQSDPIVSVGDLDLRAATVFAPPVNWALTGSPPTPPALAGSSPAAPAL